MSMHLTIYVGPFLRCQRKPEADHCENPYDLTDGRLMDLRGELYSDDGNVSYVGPNVPMPQITRQLTFDRHKATPVAFGINQGDEMKAFIAQFSADMVALRRVYESVTIEWGIVPGYS